MSDLANLFTSDAKVVISPDEMRAWVSLPPPPEGMAYTAAALAAWLPQKGVAYGVQNDLLQQAVNSERYYELLEVARGKPPVDATAGGYTLHIEKIPFSGLRGEADGSLRYDDLSFLQEAAAGQLLATIHPGDAGTAGISVRGEEVAPKPAAEGQTIQGSGFEISEDGTRVTAPALSHVSVLNDRLVVTPLKKMEKLGPEDGKITFDGNLYIETDVLPGAAADVTGSIFVVGRTAAAHLTAGRNILLCEGLRGEQGFGTLQAKENVWGRHFESANIKAGGDICSNYLIGCEATAGGRASVLGGRGTVSNTHLYTKTGLVAVQLGNEQGESTTIHCGMGPELIDRFEAVEKKITKLAPDVQTLQQNITAYERVHRNRPGGGKDNADYKEMLSKKEQQLGVLNILSAERTRLKRIMDQYSTVAVIVRQTAYPGVIVSIDTRSIEVQRPLNKVKFKRILDVIEVSAISNR